MTVPLAPNSKVPIREASGQAAITASSALSGPWGAARGLLPGHIAPDGDGESRRTGGDRFAAGADQRHAAADVRRAGARPTEFTLDRRDFELLRGRDFDGVGARR